MMMWDKGHDRRSRWFPAVQDGILVAMHYSAPQPSAGWYPDPAGSGDERYWDGASWSDVTRPDSRSSKPVGHGGVGIYSTITQPWTGVRYASWGSRVAARILDGLILAIPSYLLIKLLAPGLYESFEAWMYELIKAAQAGKSYPGEIPMELLNSLRTAGIAVMVLGVLYRALFIAGFGATVGKMALRIHVTRADDSSARTPGFVRALVRTLADELIGYFGGILLFLPTLINYLMPLFTEKKQTLHDMIARTIVVKK